MPSPPRFGCTSMVAPIKRLLLHHARDAFGSQAVIDRTWQVLHYTAPPDFVQSVADYEAFAALLRRFDIKLHFLPPAANLTLDALYVHDPVIVAHGGAILCNMGKAARSGEPDALAAFLDQIDIPIMGRITGTGRLEGGDVVWLDDHTVAVGQGYRTNAEGIRQLITMLGERVDEVIHVPLPHWNGPADVLHLMSLLSPLDEDLAIVYSRLIPVPFRQRLLARGMTLIEVPEEEYATLGCNVLAVAPRQAILADGNPATERLLAQHGVTVWTYAADQISRKGEGGPTCLTRPLWR